MTDLEKLVNLMRDNAREITEWGGEILYLVSPEKLADHLIANGVTVQEWLDDQPTFDVEPVRHGRWKENDNA